MNDTKGYCMILTTCPNIKEADELATKMIEQKLAACIQITAITSYYKWEGSTNKDAEHLMLIKTRSELYPGIEEYIKEHHSYEVPEIIRVPVQNGLPAYLNWIDEVTG
ncbi:MAG: divalent-cation tolerance protein CutA [Deltaproteobacteria bacterium]|nr:divalent-cation tolerance protein CutA [Deltaproteobacteria bacterium]